MKISVIIPVYYNQDNLKPLYYNIQEKLYIHKEYEWELVLVNDGSQDDSYEIMKELANQDNRIKFIIFPGISVLMQLFCVDCLNAVVIVQS